MVNKHLRNALQNLAILLLSLSALFLISRLPLFHTSWAAQVQSLLVPRPADGDQTQAGGPEEMFPAVHVMVTSDIEYGRYGQLHVDGADPLLDQLIPLFQEALGSATELGAAADKTLREALEEPGLYLDLTGQLPLEVAAAWLGEEVELERDVRSMALTCEEEDAVLYLRSEAGEIFRYATALPASAVREVCAGLSPNGSTFAYETNYAPLAPYTVLVAETEDAPAVQGDLPAAYSTYNLLTALDFNPHTVFRYTESSGAEVVEESPRTLRISPDGAVSFNSRGEAAAPLYQVRASAGDKPEAREALRAAWGLAEALTEGAGASPLRLRAVEEREDGWTIFFRYQTQGLPVYFSDEGDALSVIITGGAITAFSYRCRAYTALEETAALLPPDMAQAIASLYPGAGLSIGYVDSGAGEMTAQWLAR